MSMNVWTGTGNLVRDPETRQTSTGKSITGFSIAVSVGFGASKSTMYLKVSAWEKLGNFVQQYAHKGSSVAVTGPLSCNTYTDKNGVEKQSWEINARDVELLSKKSEISSEHTTGEIEF